MSNQQELWTHYRQMEGRRSKRLSERPLQTLRRSPPRGPRASSADSGRIQGRRTPPPRFGKLRPRGNGPTVDTPMTMNPALPPTWDRTHYLVHLGSAEQVASLQEGKDMQQFMQPQLRFHGARRPGRRGFATPSLRFRPRRPSPAPVGRAPPPRPSPAPEAESRPRRPSPTPQAEPLSAGRAPPNPPASGRLA